MFVIPLIATVVSLIFAYLVFRQYAERRNPAQLAWSVALLMFSIASWAMTVAAISGWTGPLAKIFYLFGASLVVGYLALGTLYLLAPRWAGHLTLVVLLALTAYITAIILAAPVDEANLATEGWEAMERPLVLRLLVGIVTNGIGSLILIGGALYSAVVTWRRQVYRERMIGNILIAAGVLIVASGNTLSGLFRIGGDTALGISISVGVVVMFLGFLEIGRSGRTSAEGPPQAT